MNILQLIQERIRLALVEIVPDPSQYAGMVKQSQDAKHGDYQANCAMPIGKALGQNPRQVAQEIVARIPENDLVEKPEIAGPGFINLRLRGDWLATQIKQIAADSRLGIGTVSPQTIVIDYSSPNVAKPMHVGHLRSTIIGDALARILRFQGHRVIADNHLGDWGTQFGILLYGYKNFRDEAALRKDPVREMTRIYVHVRELMKGDDEAEDAANPVAQAARAETAKLHAGDRENLALWKQFMPWCLEEIDRIYRRLDVHFDHTHGESFYQPMLADVVRDLIEKGIATVSDGAVVVFLEDEKPPALIRKRDGAFTYTTSDLATIGYRDTEWHADQMLYVVDARQALHFKNLFAAARRWGYDRVKLEHIQFGSVLGNDRKPIKTREGGATELGALLDEAVERGAQAYEKTRAERRGRNEEVPDLSTEERREIAEVVGIGAVKYADLSQNRTSDYVFNWDKMLAMDGNTATYMQYAYVRNRGIFRKGNENPVEFRTSPPGAILSTPPERNLTLHLLRLEEAITTAAEEYKPNILTSYLWDVAKTYSTFNDQCHVLKAETPELRKSRLLLCDVTARVIQLSLQLLGIKTVERM